MNDVASSGTRPTSRVLVVFASFYVAFAGGVATVANNVESGREYLHSCRNLWIDLKKNGNDLRLEV